MQVLEPLKVLPADIQRDWMARLEPAREESQGGVFRLVHARRTEPRGYQGQRITVLVVDEQGLPLSGVNVAFSYSTAEPFTIGQEFKWTPPGPYRAHIVLTEGSGQIEEVQGSAVKEGQPGGMTVYVFEPDYPSDVVSGLGMLADHTGIFMTFQIRRAGIKPLPEVLADLERRVAALEQKNQVFSSAVMQTAADLPVW